MQATQQLNLSAEVKGERIVVSGSFPPPVVRFVRQLPESRYYSAHAKYAARATPLAASMLRSAGATTCDEVSRLADSWEFGQAGPYTGPLDFSGLAVTPWRHQEAAIRFCYNKPASMLAKKMGTGKSLTAIALAQLWGCRKVLVLCPKAVLGVWRREFAQYYKLPHIVHVLDQAGGAKKHAALKQGLDTLRNYPLNVFVINYESTWREPVSKELLAQHWDLIIADESHRCFRPGMMISTPTGDRPIESIQPGDRVYGYDHNSNAVVETTVTSVMRHAVSARSIVKVPGGAATANHPYYTTGKGYTDAAKAFGQEGLKINKEMRAVRQQLRGIPEPLYPESFLQQAVHGCVYPGVLDVRGMWRNFPCKQEQVEPAFLQTVLSEVKEVVQELRQHVCSSKSCFGALLCGVPTSVLREAEDDYTGLRHVRQQLFPSGVEDWPLLFELMCWSNAGQRPSGIEGGAEKSTQIPTQRPQPVQSVGGKAEEYRGEPRARLLKPQWRQWDWLNASSAVARIVAWLGLRTSGPNQGRERLWLAEPLQDRHRQFDSHDCCRSGWKEPLDQAGSGIGFSEDGFLGVARVEGDSIHERAGTTGSPGVHPDSGVCDVYNISTGTENYFAGGWLVHNCSDSQSKQTKQVDSMGLKSARKLALTGTPMPSSIMNIFGQYKFLEAGIYGTSVTQFRSRYAVTHPEYKSKIVETINEDEFIEKYKLIAFNVESRDVLDLPPISYQTIPVSLTSKTEKRYRQMLREAYLELESGEVSAQNAGVKSLRLCQICSGHVKNDMEEIVTVGTEKRDALLDLLTDIREPVVVFCRFTADLAAVREVAAKLKRKYGEISGQQRDLTDHATMPEGVDIMGVQERAGGTGIDLTRARIAVDYSRGYSLGDYEQKIARVHRPGQDRSTIIYQLVVPSTVDEAIVKAVRSKADVVEAILAHIRWGGE